MWENGEASLPTYLKSLQSELVGCNGIIEALQNDARFLTLLSILEYLSGHPDCPIQDVKREVFKAISVCNKLKEHYKEVM